MAPVPEAHALGEHDLYLFNEGTHSRLFACLGALPLEVAHHRDPGRIGGPGAEDRAAFEGERGRNFIGDRARFDAAAEALEFI